MLKNIMLAFKLLKMYNSKELIITTCAFCRHIQFTNPVVQADTNRAFASEEKLKELENKEFYNYKMSCKNCGEKVLVSEVWDK